MNLSLKVTTYSIIFLVIYLVWAVAGHPKHDETDLTDGTRNYF